MFATMKAAAFDMDVPLDERRIIVRYGDDGVEMVELPWGLKPKDPGGRPFNLVPVSYTHLTLPTNREV